MTSLSRVDSTCVRALENDFGWRLARRRPAARRAMMARVALPACVALALLFFSAGAAHAAEDDFATGHSAAPVTAFRGAGGTVSQIHVTGHVPVTNAVGVAVTANITAGFNSTLLPATVTTRTFTVRSSFRGLFTDTATVSGSGLTLNPGRDFFAGEQVQVVGTAAISSSGGAPLNPIQWGFTAGPVKLRCLVGFVDSGTADDALTAVSNSSVAWGDYDNDGDLDILLTGYDGSVRVAKIYRNNSGVLVDSGPADDALTGVDYSSVAWGDYDNDGDLDILLTGAIDAALNPVAKIYRNNGGVLVDSGPADDALTGVGLSSVAWGDYDNDGDLDILLTGRFSSLISVAKIYRNDGGSFVDSGTADDALIGVRESSVAWGDYDNDGDLDILLTGFSGFIGVAKVYRNDGGSFVDGGAVDDALIGVGNSSAAWGDYDNDGDLDILLTGYSGVAKVYRNDGGSFVDSGTADDALTGVYTGSVAWGDYDNDGDLDILLTGTTNGDPSDAVAKLYRNNGGVFVDSGAADDALTGVLLSSVAWGDYDNDGDLDILLTGFSSGNNRLGKLYRNEDCADMALAGHNPVTNAVGVAVTANITAGFDATLNPATVTTRTFTVRSSFRGLFTDTATVSGSGLTLNPGRDFFAGEQVQVVGTAAMRSTIDAPLQPTQWGFTAGPVKLRCLVGFVDSGTADDALTAVSSSSVAWGDYDNDGDLDILLTGYDGSVRVAKVYRNDGGVLVDSGTADDALTGVDYSSVAWGDYDNDGDLDILLTGAIDAGFNPVAKIYRNNGGVFVDSGTADDALTAVGASSVAWGDYDNDGDLDILLTGRFNSGVRVAKIYRNDGGSFVDSGTADDALTVVQESSVAWGDYDNDGDLDILLTGYSSSFTGVAKVYRNDGGVFVDSGTADDALIGVSSSSVAWGDYDNDGDLDILLTGLDGGGVAKVYRNDGGVLVDSGTADDALTGAYIGSVAWGDHDNDGDLDILLTGTTTGAPTNALAKVYRNNGGVFVDSGTADDILPGVQGSSVAWGDYDNDGDLDILLTGFSSGNNRLGKLYRNEDCADMALAGHDPVTNAVGVAVTANITAGFDAALNPATVTTRTFTVRSSFRGLFTTPAIVSGSGLTLNPGRDFFAGEQVQVVGTAAMRSTIDAPLKPTQWGFTAGPVKPRCLVGFVDSGTADDALTGVDYGSVAWGDYDNDGDLDLLLTGEDSSFNRLTKLYRNDGGVLVDSGTADDALTGVSDSSVAWGDYDNDGDLDLLLTGAIDAAGNPVAKIYRNDGGVLVDSGPVDDALTGVLYSSVAWGDYDNDGDLDILLTGAIDAVGNPVAKIYRNDGGVLVDSGPVGDALTGVYLSSVAWGDYDNDGDLDLLLTGEDSGFNAVAKLYRNNDSVFVDSGTADDALIGVANSSVAWGDYDNDGDLDILLTGYNGVADSAKLYRNTGGVFADSGTADDALTGVYLSSVAWGDYDNDGDLDLLLTGEDSGFNAVAKLYRNNNSVLVDSGTADDALTGVANSSVAWGDYDNDGDLDLLLTGYNGVAGSAKLYRNEDCADVALVKTVTPAGAAPGAAITYTLRFTNAGPGIARSVALSDSIPLSVTITGVASSTVGSGVILTQTSGGPNFRWIVSDLAMGKGGVITLTGTLSPNAAATGALITNTAAITAFNDITAGNNRAGAAFSVLATLRVARTGTGGGTVVSSPAGITCGVDCTEALKYGTVVTLTNTPAAGSTFTGWSGACTGSGACVVTMTGAKSVTATFTLNSYALTTATAGTGSGAVTLSPAGGTYSHGTVVTVTNTPATGSTFTGWSGACTGSGACTVTMNGAKSVTATFSLNSYALTTATAGTGSGTVTLSPAGGAYSHGTVVTVTNTPAAGSTFTGWSGACTGSGACVVTMNGAKSVTATFTLNRYALGTGTSGTGSGAVTLSPAGGTYNHGTVVTATNTPAAGSTFTGWSGACTGSGACVVTMNGAKSVTATFSLNSYALTTATAGTGGGAVTLSPAGGTYSHGTVVTVTNTPATGSTFTGWSGACAGTVSCVVTMDVAKLVTATFTLDSLDSFAVLVQPANGLTTSEAGASATFTVALTAQPSAAVTVTLASSDVSEGTVSPAQMIFTGADWNTPQIATVTGVDDDVDDGDVAYTIVTTVSSDDPNYNGLAAADVSVTNIDDDGAATANIYLPLILKPGPPASAGAAGETMGRDGIPDLLEPNRSPAFEPGEGRDRMFLPLLWR